MGDVLVVEKKILIFILFVNFFFLSVEKQLDVLCPVNLTLIGLVNEFIKPNEPV